MKKGLIRYIILAVVATLELSVGIDTQAASPEANLVQQVIDNSGTIVHAAGGLVRSVDGNTWKYSNSREGIENCIAKQKNVIELDFIETTDGQWICAHDWSRLYLNGIKIEKPIAFTDFLQTRVYDDFSPIWLGDVISYMQQNPQLYIVTDVKDENANIDLCNTIAFYCPDLKDRFIIQIYHEEEYEPIVTAGFKNIIFTLYQTKKSERTKEKLIQMAEQHPLVGYTFPAEFVKDADFFCGVKEAGVPLYVHTVNEPEEMQYYFVNGIQAVYTDCVD